jgi:hypothetical protein
MYVLGIVCLDFSISPTANTDGGSRILLSVTFIKQIYFPPFVFELQLYVTTDGQPASLPWNKAPIWGLRPDLYYMCDSYDLVPVGRPL